MSERSEGVPSVAAVARNEGVQSLTELRSKAVRFGADAAGLRPAAGRDDQIDGYLAQIMTELEAIFTTAEYLVDENIAAGLPPAGPRILARLRAFRKQLGKRDQAP